VRDFPAEHREEPLALCDVESALLGEQDAPVAADQQDVAHASTQLEGGPESA
jgi:hypothetical protein